jgi:hypothetical protein
MKEQKRTDKYLSFKLPQFPSPFCFLIGAVSSRHYNKDKLAEVNTSSQLLNTVRVVAEDVSSMNDDCYL